MKRSLFVFFTPFLLLLAACNKDFSPNADWKELPAVYCALDQDDDTTFVRVQKCYLGPGNLYDYARVYDSINFPQGYIRVEIEVWKNRDEMNKAGTSPLRILNFEYMERDKDSGSFAAGRQPLFYHVNRAGDLNEDYVYRLRVLKADNDQLLAYAVTDLVKDYRDGTWLVNPYPVGPSDFAHTFNMLYGYCELRWHPFEGGRLYQPTLRFFYRHKQPGDTLLYFADIPCPSSHFVSNASTSSVMSYRMEKEHFLLEVKNALAHDTLRKQFVDTVGILLQVCNEELNAYINTTANSQVLIQDRIVYSNIVGGVGIFGSRRTHLSSLAIADNGDNSNPPGLHYLLEQLNIGF